MGKKGRRVQVVQETTDLDSFNAAEEAKKLVQSNAKQGQKIVEFQTQGQIQYSKSLEKVIDRDLQHYFYLDNKMIEQNCYPDNFNFNTQQEQRESLEEELILFNIRHNLQELDYVLNLPFGMFWAQMTKSDKVIAYLDTFLSNIRRVNDTYKLQIVALGNNSKKQNDPFTLSMMGGNQSRSVDVVEHVNFLLQTVFQIFSRLSLKEESEDLKFPLGQYQELIYNNFLFDLAKLYDIAAVYGPQNPEAVRKLISNVFENDMRFLQEFKESVDTIITLLKKCFNAALRVTEMIKDETVTERNQSQKDEVIRRLLLDFSEILTNIELTTQYFPESMLETVRNTTLPIFMANVYSLMIGPGKLWLKNSEHAKELEIIRKSLKTLALFSCITILDVTIVKCVGVHTKNYAVVQNRIGQSLKQFLFGVTGNLELTKDSLHRNQNYLCENNSGQKFLKKLINHTNNKGDYSVDLVTAIQGLDERFLDQSDKEMALIILKSLARGQTVNVSKVGGPAPQQAFGTKDTPMNPVDKDNIKSILDMLAGQFSRQQIEQVYLKTNKNFEQTLDMFLNGQVTQTQEKIVVQINEPIQINTISEPKKVQKDIQAYVMEEYKDILFPKQVSKFAKKASMDHQRYLSLQQDQEDQDNRQIHQRIIELSNEMQYDDDAEESKVKVFIPQTTKKQEKTEVKEFNKQEEESDDDLDDVQFFIERQSSNVEDKPIDYLGMEEAPIKSQAKKVEVQKEQDQKQNKQNNNRRKEDSKKELPSDHVYKPENQRGGRGKQEGGQTTQQYRPKQENKNQEDDQRPQRGNRGNRGEQRGARDQYRGRGGYRDDFQRDVVDKDNEYTTKNPLNNNEQTEEQQDAQNEQPQRGTQQRGRGDQRGRGRGVQNRRGGAHNQKAMAARKTGLYQQNFE